MRLLSWRLPPLFLVVALFLLFASLTLEHRLSPHSTALDSRGFDSRQDSSLVAAETAEYHGEGYEDNGATAVQESMEILDKLKPATKRVARFAKPSGILGTTTYYFRWAFTLVFMNGPSQQDMISLKQKPQKLNPPLSKAVELLKGAAEQDNPDAMYLLGEMNFYGNYTHPRNYSEAFRWYKDLATLNGNSSAQHMIGFIYATGIGGAVRQDQAKALLYHTFAAEAGHIRSQMTVAFRHHMGIAAPRNCDEAVHFYKQVADKGMRYMKSGPPGGHMPGIEAYRYADDYGGVYGEGASVVSSGIRAKRGPAHSDTWAAMEDVVELMHFHSRKGDMRAALRLGRLHYDGTRTIKRDLRIAKEYFLEVARKYWTKDGKVKNDVAAGIDKYASIAAGYLGRMFLRGEGMEQNFHKARIWFKRGIENGDALSQYSMGLMHLMGLGVPPDPVKAATYFAPAADQDLAAAQVRLGTLFLDQGDVTTATRYYDLAVRNGHMEALYYLAEMSNQGIGRDRSCGTAAVYYKIVAEKAEIIHSSFREANEAYENGDLQTALVNHMMAAEQGYEIGQANVAYFLDKTYTHSFLSSIIPYTKHKLTQLTDAALALLYWTRSAKQQNIDSLVKMGDYYLDGIGSSPDREKAASCYQVAAETLQSAQAMWNLGWMHENGIGMEQDFHLAKRFYDQSLETNTEAYLPVHLALLRLRARSYWNSVTHGSVNSIKEDPPAEKRKWSFSEWVTAFLEADAAQNAERGGEFDPEDDDEAWASAGEGPLGDELYDEIDDGIVETLVIVGLAAALAALVYYRQQRQVRHRQAAEAQGQAEAQRQRQRGRAEQQQDGGEDQAMQDGARLAEELRLAQEDRGVFPRAGEPEFNNWVAGGIGH